MTRVAVSLAIVLCLGAQTGARDPFEGGKAGDIREIGGVKFRWCPAGRFRMGSPVSEVGHRADEGPVDVTLSRGFWMGEYEVTQGEWQSVAGAFPRQMNKGEGGDVPVYWVSYLDAERFCRKLTERARAAGELPQTWEIRLPSEAQWEYACRAVTTTATAFGDHLSGKQANFNGKAYNGAEEWPSTGRSVKVGSYPPNAWGLYDMHGSVWEWCRDWYHASLPGGVDPDMSAQRGLPNRDGTYSRVRRGGAWIEDGWACRSAMRLRYEPDRNSDHIGFRVMAERR